MVLSRLGKTNSKTNTAKDSKKVKSQQKKIEQKMNTTNTLNQDQLTASFLSLNQGKGCSNILGQIGGKLRHLLAKRKRKNLMKKLEGDISTATPVTPTAPVMEDTPLPTAEAPEIDLDPSHDLGEGRPRTLTLTSLRDFMKRGAYFKDESQWTVASEQTFTSLPADWTVNFDKSAANWCAAADQTKDKTFLSTRSLDVNMTRPDPVSSPRSQSLINLYATLLDETKQTQATLENTADLTNDLDTTLYEEDELNDAVLDLDEEEGSSFEHQMAASISSVFRCEEDFVDLMNCGLDLFSHPLKYDILSPKEHGILFQNVEKLIAISEFHLTKMRMNWQQAAQDEMLSVYISKVGVMCDAYESYAEGLPTALDCLDRLDDNELFLEYLEKLADYDLCDTMEKFLRRPLKHLSDILGHLETQLEETSPHHPCFNHLERVVAELVATHDAILKCKKPRESNGSGTDAPQDSTDSYLDQLSLVYEDTRTSVDCTQSFNSQSTWSEASYESTTSSTDSNCSAIDQGLLNLQDRLRFAAHQQPMLFATASRQLIFSGDLVQVNPDNTCTHLHAVLMSDLVLLTERLTSGQLLVSQWPVVLKDVVSMDFDWTVSTQSTSFRLIVKSSKVPGKVGRYIFRALTTQDKWTWKTLLEQRVNICKMAHQGALLGANPDSLFI